MSAFGGKADVIADPSACLLIARSGHLNPLPAPSMMPVTDRGNATYGHSDAARGRPIAPPQTNQATTHITTP